MNYWIFKANPEHYRIDDRLLEPDPNIIWAVTRYHDRIQKGDTVFVWRAGTPRGICAIMLIDACPYVPQEQEVHDGFELPAASLAPAPDHWAKAHFIRRFATIEVPIIKKIPGLELFSFFSAFQQAINFTLTRPEGSILLDFIENRPLEAPVKQVVKARRPEPARAAAIKKATPAASGGVALLKCAACGRYVISSDTDRHVLESHNGDPVTWRKTK